MDVQFRYRATVAIWVSFTIILVSLFAALSVSNAMLDSVLTLGAVFMFVTFLTAVAGYATRSVWRDSRPAALPPESQATVQKAKRSYSERVQSLIHNLDEDEIIELETLLLSRQQDADRE